MFRCTEEEKTVQLEGMRHQRLNQSKGRGLRKLSGCSPDPRGGGDVEASFTGLYGELSPWGQRVPLGEAGLEVIWGPGGCEILIAV